MSVFFDCLWWWRGTFNNKANPYTEKEVVVGVGAPSSAELPNNNTNNSPAALQMIAGTGGGESQDPVAAHGAIFDLSDIPDWDWDVLCNVNWDQQPGI
jgi:hypothetical protein